MVTFESAIVLTTTTAEHTKGSVEHCLAYLNSPTPYIREMART